MNVVFLGTPAFAVPTLRALVASPHRVTGVVTQPDRPRGRGGRLSSPLIAVEAQAAHLDLWQTEDVNAPESLAWIQARSPAVGVVVAFGQFLNKALRELPGSGFINLHASLLPAYRGAAPVHAALRAGESRTGVSIMQVERRMDAGAVLARLAVDVDPDENVGQLTERLALLGAPLVVEVLDRLAAGTAEATLQDEDRATHVGRISASERTVNWTWPAEAVHNHVRGLTPHPGAITRFEPVSGAPFLVRITRTSVVAGSGGDLPENVEPGEPGTVIGVEGEAIRVAAGEGSVRVHGLVPAGSREMTAAEFIRGRARDGGRFRSAP